MNSDLHDFFCRSYSLEHTKRYSMVPVIHPESVATHSFFVALGVLLLRNTYKFDVQKAALIALCHDLAEMDISDVNHLVKKTYPAVAKALQDAEEQIIKGFPDEVRPYCEMYGDHSVEAMIVHYADAFQCAQYATNELGMGNTGYMEDVLKNSNRRMRELELKLQPYGIEND
jgi:5'-deoxynucleotidase YfbR-like HD superfamily hydrolase